jgi:hypothetical protein
MPLVKTLPDNAGPPVIYTKYPEIYGSCRGVAAGAMK